MLEHIKFYRYRYECSCACARADVVSETLSPLLLLRLSDGEWYVHGTFEGFLTSTRPTRSRDLDWMQNILCLRRSRNFSARINWQSCATEWWAKWKYDCVCVRTYKIQLKWITLRVKFIVYTYETHRPASQRCLFAIPTLTHTHKHPNARTHTHAQSEKEMDLEWAKAVEISQQFNGPSHLSGPFT